MAVSNWNQALPVMLLWLLAFSGLAASQTITASNLTSDLSSGTTRFYLNNTQLELPTLDLTPLTDALAGMSQSDFQNFRISGSLINVSPDNVNTLKQGDIALISCDESAYTGNIGPSSTFFMASTCCSPGPVAIVLYSVHSNHCNYSYTSSFDVTFTTTNQDSAARVVNRNTSGLVTTPNSYIQPNTTSGKGTQSSSPGSANGSSSSFIGPNGPTPTTATAMIILYAITGIITALFLVIIVTGAIRAHRHPEIYGPRNVVGRTRQSRAKGIARAMLETLPIVKFGDPDPKEAAKTTDIELANSSGEDSASEHSKEAPAKTEAKETTADTPENESESQAEPTASSSQLNTDATPAAATPRPDGRHEDGSLGCSICTEDFAKGQEVRVLPCNHKFHPACIDPWLLNVSGTCPLCRTNLNPEGTEENNTENSTTTTNFQVPPPAVAPNPRTALNPLSSMLSPRRFERRVSHLTSDERIAAVRQLNAEPNTQEERPRLSARLRDRLGIRTRRQGDEASANPSTESVAQAQQETSSSSPDAPPTTSHPPTGQ